MNLPEVSEAKLRLQAQLEKVRFEFRIESVELAAELEELLRQLTLARESKAVLARLVEVSHHLVSAVGSSGSSEGVEHVRAMAEQIRESSKKAGGPGASLIVEWLNCAAQLRADLRATEAVVPCYAESAVVPAECPGRILILEDNEVHARWLALILESAGHTTHVVHAVAQFQRAFSEFNPDLLIFDVYLPDGNGHGLAALVREGRRRSLVPIVFVTGGKEKGARLDALQSGGDDYLAKPVDPALLLSSVEGRISRYQKVKAASSVDSATQLLSEWRFSAEVEKAVARFGTGREEAVLVLMQIDGWKGLEAQHGREMADEVLQILGRIIHRNLGFFDYAARTRDGEFVLFFEGATPQVASSVCECMLRQFREFRHTSPIAQSFHSTFSAVVSGYAGREIRADAWRLALEPGLRAVQSQGGNRVRADDGVTQE